MTQALWLSLWLLRPISAYIKSPIKQIKDVLVIILIILFFASCIFVWSISAVALTGNITTVAGAGLVGDGGQATDAWLLWPQNVAVDPAGNLFIADTENRRLRKVERQTGIITTVVSSLDHPKDLFFDSKGNLFILDGGRIRKIEGQTGMIATVAGGGQWGILGDGGQADLAWLGNPQGLFVDLLGNLFIADEENNRIRKIEAQTGVITTVAGSGAIGYGQGGFSGDGGLATQAKLNHPNDVFVDPSGNIFISDRDNHRIRKVEAQTGIITTIAGTGEWGFSGDEGPATQAKLAGPSGIFIDSSGNLLIVDTWNNRIRKVNAQGIISTVAGGNWGFSGDGGLATQASLRNPIGVFVDSLGNIFIADKDNHRIRKVDGQTGSITTVAGSGIIGDGGLATQARLLIPTGVFVDALGNIFIADKDNHRIRKVEAQTGNIATVAGTGELGSSGDGGPAILSRLAYPNAVFVDSNSNLFIAESGRIRKVDKQTGVITTVAGGGQWSVLGDGGLATQAWLGSPSGIFVDSLGNIFIADAGNNRIRKVDGLSGIITTVAGSGPSGYSQGGFSGDGGPATQAMLSRPSDVFVDPLGNILIADSENRRLRKVDKQTGIISTVAGIGEWGFSGDGGPATQARISYSRSVFVDSLGNLFIADEHNQRIRKVDAQTGVISTVAGGNWGFSGDGGPATQASLRGPTGVFVDSLGNLFVADSWNHRIRKVEGIAAPTTLGGPAGPAVAIISPTPNQNFPSGTTSITLKVLMVNHAGHWHWQLNAPFPSSGAAGGNIVEAGDTATITGLTNERTYTVHVTLVDANHNVLSPPVTTSLTFSVSVPLLPPTPPPPFPPSFIVDENYNGLIPGASLSGWTAGVFAQSDTIPPGGGSGAAKVTTNIPSAYRDFQLTTGIITVEVWMKPKMGSDTNHGLHIGNHLSGKNSGGDYIKDMVIVNKNDQDIWFYSEYGIAAPVPFANYDGNWHHFKVSYNTATNRYTLYMDSNLVRSEILSPLDLSAGISHVGMNSGRWGREVDTTSYFDELKVYTTTPPTLSTSYRFSLSLKKGLNMISLPLKPQTPYTAKSFANFLGATVIIRIYQYDIAQSRFVPYIPAVASDVEGFPIEGGRGYIINVLQDKEVKFFGQPWGELMPTGLPEPPPVGSAPPRDELNPNISLFASADIPASVWAFVVSGLLQDSNHVLPQFEKIIVIVKNLRSGLTATTTAEEGKFQAVFVDLSRSPVAIAGDTLEVVALDSNGKRVSGPFRLEVQPQHLRVAYLHTRMLLGDVIPEKTRLLANYPNPFNPETWIPYELSESSKVTLHLYDVTGRLVRRLELGYKSAGIYVDKPRAIYWDGRNDNGERVSSGVYFYHLQAGSYTAVRKMVVVK